MARTKASVGSKVSSGKSSKARCCAAPTPSTSGSSGSSDRTKSSYGGGNPICPRETPIWQRPITNFFITKEPSRGEDLNGNNGESSAGPSKPKSKRIIYSDDDEEEDRPKNSVLDESIVLEPLNGEECHKIDEYYDKNKDKGRIEENGSESEENGEINVENNEKITENGIVNGERVEADVEINGNDNEIGRINGQDSKFNEKDNVSEMNGGKRVKGKGVGKKTNKENRSNNTEKRKSGKRDLEDEEEVVNVNKKIKV